jgi:hypothetical protein
MFQAIFNSTWVRGAVYLVPSKTLHIQMQDRTYAYEDVPLQVYLDLLVEAAEGRSVGAYVNKVVKPHYELVKPATAVAA